MDDKRIAEIRERHARATKGPWWLSRGGATVRATETHKNAVGGFITFEAIMANLPCSPRRDANAAFIANSWQDTLDLLDENDRLRAEVERLQAEIGRWEDVARHAMYNVGGSHVV